VLTADFLILKDLALVPRNEETITAVRFVGGIIGIKGTRQRIPRCARRRQSIPFREVRERPTVSRFAPRFGAEQLPMLILLSFRRYVMRRICRLALAFLLSAMAPVSARATATLVKDINTGGEYSVGPGGFFQAGSLLLFEGNQIPTGTELWRSDGTAAGTVLVKDINPGSASSFAGTPSFANVSGTIFFPANDGVELWKTDGTTAGTVLVSDIFPGSPDSFPQSLTAFGGMLIFAADDGTNGMELWKSDGTAAGTTLLKDINPGSLDSTPFGFTEFNGELFFIADDGDGNGQEPWKTDGTPAGTVPVANIGIAGLTVAGGHLFFYTSFQLWTSDGTAGGTTLLKNFDDIVPLLGAVNGTLISSPTTSWRASSCGRATAPLPAHRS
jgi:ELWxxDGT repeat protein